MLKKFLTTIIVLAATATAWADGYGYALDKDGARATITTGEQTLEEVITAIKGLTPTVQYVILPDGMTKAEVNSIATENGFVVAVSKNEATTTETKWVYTYNDEEFIYEGTPTTTDGVSKATVKVHVPLRVTGYSYKFYGNDYARTVFYDSNGNCYGVQNESSDIFSLTKSEGYTYNNGATEYTGKVAESGGKYYGVINNPTEVDLELNMPVSWTYNSNSITYAHFGEVYNSYGNYIFWQGGTEYDLTTETRYTYDEYGQKKLYTGATRTADGKTYGNTGTSFNVSYVKDAYTYENGTKVYTGATRTADGKTYGNTGSGEVTLTSEQAYTYENGTKVYTGPVRTTVVDGKTQYYGNTGEMLPLTTTKDAPRTYKDPNWPNPTCIYDGEYVSGENGNVGGTFYELTNVPATEENPVYTFTINDADHGWNQITYCSKEVNVVTDQSGNVTGYTLNDGTVLSNVTKNISGDFKYYNKPDDAMNYVYNGTVYTKLDGTGQYACEGGTSVAITKAAENVKYYNDTDKKKVVYTGNVYTDNDNKEYGVKDINYDKELTYGTVYYNGDVLFTGNVYDKTTNEGTVKVGYTNSDEKLLEQKNVYVKDDNVIVYSGNVYTKDGKSVGFENGTDQKLDYGEVKLYTNKDGQILIATDNSRISLDGDTYCEGGSDIRLQAKDQYYTANLYTDGEGRSVIYTGKVYGDATGYIGGTETELDYGDIYKKEDGTIYTGYRNADNTKGCNNAQTLTTSFTYEYVNPNTGETATLESENHLTTYEVDYTVTVEQKEIEVPTGKIHLIAYVSIPGSLYYAIGDKGFGGADLTALTLSGSLNAADIASHNGMKLTGNGHAKYKTYPSAGQETDNDPIVPADDNAMPGTYPTFANITLLTYIDFSDAVFNVQTDMQINNMAHSVNGLKTVFLPTNEKMTEIPAHCLWGANGIEEICIPYNYEKIGAEAFYNTSISHFYTTDAAGNIITNGPNTMTFSENLRIIETSDSHEPTFSGAGANKITDVYVMRYNPEDTEYPTTQCQPNAFQASMTWGNGGNAGDIAHPISRANYQNQDMWISILHYPQSTEGTEHEHMYTDLTRVYTLKDETGFVDGKGKAFEWPKHGEFTQASNCIKGENGKKFTHFDGTPYDENFLAKYRGWIEFVLVGKSNNERIDVQKETEFIQRDWYTLCVPYNLRKSHLLELFGIDPDKSANNKVKMLKETESKDVTDTMYPDIRTITEISRSVSNGKMAIHLSKPLLNDKDGNNWEVVIGKDGKGFDYNLLEGEDPVIIKGGHPFLIRGYVPAAWNDKIKNLGMYIMAIAASDNSNAVLEGKEEPYKYNDECLVNNVALPCVKHHIHARNNDYNVNDENNKNQFVFKDAAHTDAACYHFIGTYTETKIPQYAYYIGKAGDGSHKFSRTTKTTFKWAPYSAVIVGLNNPKYNDDDFKEGKTDIHNIIVGLDTPTNDLIILEGEDSARAGQALSIKFDENAFSGEATGITDININSNVNISNNKVYSINGQYMGTSLNNLPKGIYIINGQKKVVK